MDLAVEFVHRLQQRRVGFEAEIHNALVGIGMGRISLFAGTKRVANDPEVVVILGGRGNTVEGVRVAGSVNLRDVPSELINKLSAARANMILIVNSVGPSAGSTVRVASGCGQAGRSGVSHSPGRIKAAKRHARGAVRNPARGGW